MEERIRKILISLLLILILILIPFFKRITGLMHDILTISLNIGTSIKSCIYLLNPERIEKDTVANFTLYCRNCGSVDYTGRSELVIKQGERYIFSIMSEPYELKVNDEKFFGIGWLASYPTGEYQLVGRCYQDGTYEEVIREFTIFVPPAPSPPPAPPPKIPPSVEKIANFTVEYPKTLNLTQATEYVVIFKVTNTGNVDLTNLTLSFNTTDFKIEVIYPRMVTLNPEDSIIFTVKLFVPPELKPGNYTINWDVSSTEFSKSGTILARVKVLEIKEKAKELLAYYSSLIDKLEAEIAELEKEGKDTTLAKSLLDEARVGLNAAKELFKLMMYEECIEKLEDVRDTIKRLAIEIARLKMLPKPAPVVMPIWISPLFILLLILIILIIVVAVILLTRRRRRVGIVRLRRFSFE